MGTLNTFGVNFCSCSGQAKTVESLFMTSVLEHTLSSTNDNAAHPMASLCFHFPAASICAGYTLWALINLMFFFESLEGLRQQDHLQTQSQRTYCCLLIPAKCTQDGIFHYEEWSSLCEHRLFWAPVASWLSNFHHRKQPRIFKTFCEWNRLSTKIWLLVRKENQWHSFCNKILILMFSCVSKTTLKTLCDFVHCYVWINTQHPRLLKSTFPLK